MSGSASRHTDAAALLARLPGRIGTMLDGAIANAAPGQLAMCDERGTWDYAALGGAIEAGAMLLAAHGVGAGDRVIILGENSRAMAVLMLAAMRVDAVAVPLNPRLAAGEIDRIIDHADASLCLFCLDGSSRPSRSHAERHGATIIDDPVFGTLGVRAGHSQSGPSHADVGLMIYTSGSSGAPKGVELTHRNLLYMAAASGEIRRLSPVDRFYVLLPLSHIVAVAVLLLGGLMHGTGLILAGRFTPRGLMDALARQDVSILLATPALIGMLLDANRGGPVPLAAPRLRIVSVSGAPLDATTKQAAETLFGLNLHQGYGITECGPTVAQMRPEDPRADLSVGRLLPGVEARLMRGDGSEAGMGETGELFVRGPGVMHGYFRAPEETRAVLDAQGWFRTGDLARFEGDHLFIAGRVKELVIRYGYNVYPAEVEAALSRHPAVQACAVVGRTPAVAGAEEELLAFVQLSRGAAAVDEAELNRHAAMFLAPYKRPSQIVIVAELPRTPSGKLNKPALLALPDCQAAA